MRLRLTIILLVFGSLELWAGAPDSAPGSTEAAGPAHRSSDVALPRCGFLSRRGAIWDKTYSDGSRLRVFCRDRRSLNLMPGFVGIFQDARGLRITIGRCGFRRGCNRVVVNETVEPEAVYLFSTTWESTDGKLHKQTAAGSPPPGAQVQAKTWFFEVATRKVVLTSRTYSAASPQHSVKGCDVRRLRGELLSETQTEYMY